MNLWSIVIPTLILAAGVIDDLRSRKVHNELVIAAALVAVGFSFFEGGWPQVQQGLIAMSAALLCSLPLVLFKILGAGDMKLFMAFGLATSWSTVIAVGVSSLIWGAVLGVFRALMGGELKSLLKNTASLLIRQPVEQKEYHRIPYTVALFMGWMTHVADILRSGAGQ